MVLARFHQTPGLVEIDDTRDVPGIEWRLVVDRAQAAKFGADVALVGRYVQLVTKGMKIPDDRPADRAEEIDVVVRPPGAMRPETPRVGKEGASTVTSWGAPYT